jgi:hypothetical protein
MDTQQQIVGERGIGVQLSGGGNTVIVYAGSAELHLVPKHRRKAERLETELQLLRVDLRATTLLGRDAELATLRAWLDSPRLISVRCITGRAGAGKTRLAVELCERADGAGWIAGFAHYAQFQEFVKQAAGWRWNGSSWSSWTTPPRSRVTYAPGSKFWRGPKHSRPGRGCGCCCSSATRSPISAGGRT